MDSTNNNTSHIDLSIALSVAQQQAMVGHCFLSEEFFLKCKNYVEPGWLASDIPTMHIYQQLLDFYKNYKAKPNSGDELLAEPFFTTQNKIDQEKYRNTLMVCLTLSQNFSLDILRPKIAHFIKTQKTREKAKSLTSTLNKHNYEKGVQAAQEIVDIWTQIDFESTPYVDFSDTDTLWTNANEIEEKHISTGSNILDELLGGGIFPGGNMAVLAPVFTGKSRFLMTLARHILVQNKRVLYIIHEDNAEKVKRRIISSICGMGPKEITNILHKNFDKLDISKLGWNADILNDNNLRSELLTLVQNELLIAKELLQNNLIFMPWQKSGRMFVEDVIDEVKRIDLEQKAKTGRGFDLIVNDYPALLRSRMKHEHERARLSYVYQSFNDLASELQTFCVYAVQVNRGTAKQMKSGEAEQVIGLEDVSESYQIAMNAMSAISLNRSKEDAEKNILTIAVIKARDSNDNGSLIVRPCYNEVSLYGDSRMYEKHGKMLISGLPSIKGKHFTEGSDALRQKLDAVAISLNQPVLISISNAPNVIKRLKNLQNNQF